MKTKISTFITGFMALIMLSISCLSAFAADLPTGGNLDEAPQNLTVELEEWEDGRPYFALKWTNPPSIWELGQYGVEHGQWGAEYQIDIKIGDGLWRSEMGESLFGNAIDFNEDHDDPGNYVTDDVLCDPMDIGVDGAVDIKANVYHIRVRYGYYANQGADGEEYYIYSPFSDIASIGVDTFYKEASDWAKSELQKAYDLGLIPDILKGADMTKPITREEFAELAVLLYENVTGKKSEPFSPNPFTDTKNQQILKAYSLLIVNGTTKTTFSPSVLINREQCATMLFRAIKAIHPTGDYSVAGVKDFPDQKDISDWAAEAAKYMYKIGILAGDAKGNFMPKATTPAQEAAGYGMATREQAIALSVRTHDKAPEIISTSAPELDLLMGKAMSIDTGYFEAVSDVSGHTTVTKYWKKGSMVKQIVTGNDETKIDIFDMSKGEAYSYFEGSTEAAKTVYAVKDPSKYINPFNIIEPYNQGSEEESAEIKITGTETIGGLSCSVITVTVNGEVLARIWVSEDGLKRRSEMIYFGFPTMTLYQNYVIGGTISDSEFELPPGMTVDEDITVTITE